MDGHCLHLMIYQLNAQSSLLIVNYQQSLPGFDPIGAGEKTLVNFLFCLLNINHLQLHKPTNQSKGII